MKARGFCPHQRAVNCIRIAYIPHSMRLWTISASNTKDASLEIRYSAHPHPIVSGIPSRSTRSRVFVTGVGSPVCFAHPFRLYGSPKISLHSRLSQVHRCRSAPATPRLQHEGASGYMKISDAIHQFFDHYLLHLKGVSQQTIGSYRDAFTLLLPFAAGYHHVPVRHLEVEHLSFDTIVSFLNHIEDRRLTAPERVISAWPPLSPLPK